MEQPSKNSLITLFVGLVVTFFVVGCASAIKPGEESGKATTRNYLVRHGIDGTLINVEFKGSKATIVAAEDKRGWKGRIGASSEFSNVVMSDFNKMKRCDLRFPQNWGSITWIFNNDGTCTIWENNRDNPAENGNAIPVEGPTLEWPTNLKDGLVVFCKFKRNAKDSGENGIDGVIHGPTPTIDRLGNKNSALLFDGKDDYIKFGPVLPDMTEMTVCVWILARNDRAFFNDGDWANGRDIIFSVGPTSVGVRGDKQGGPDHARSANDVRIGMMTRWRYVAISMTTRKTSIYVDGEIKVKLKKGCANVGHHNLIIGTHEYPQGSIGWGGYWKGEMSNLRIYNRTLTTDEIKALYELEKPKAK